MFCPFIVILHLMLFNYSVHALLYVEADPANVVKIDDEIVTHAVSSVSIRD